jgi:hypothetical protein
LYRYKKWSLTSREEHKLRVYSYENSVLRRTSEQNTNEVTGGWRKLHNEELQTLYTLPSIIITIQSRRMKWGGHAACMGMKINAYRVLVGMPEEKGPL